ncbi:MAG TPA: DUF169 domain-containing protein [Pseudobacteroides sp.]|uniref:DUF169 domain-containing protein n=1 Tax=Pseudobacteroides sp. TaxID=1968840 RepID=UPI002F91DF84
MKGICSLPALKESLTGKAVCLSSESKGCPGMKAGLGFTDSPSIPGGIECFLSCGRGEGFPHGERLKKNPEIAKAYYEGLPKNVHNAKYIVFKPVEILNNEEPKLVVFLGNPDQISALISLFSYESSFVDNVITPMTSGCSSLVKIPLNELRRDKPRAVVGLVNIWARPVFEADAFAITVPYEDYLRMEENSRDCFFQAKTWEGVKNRLE